MNEFKQPYHFIRDNYNSNGGYDPNHKYSYLIRFSREDNECYNRRKQITILNNVFTPLNDLFLDPIKAQSINIDVNTNNVNLKESIKATSLFEKANDIITSYKLYSKCYFATYTEYNEMGEPLLTQHPYIDDIFAGDVLNIVLEENEVSSIEYTEYKEFKNTNIPVHVKYENNTFVKITKAWKTSDGKITTEEQDEGLRIKNFDGVFYGIVNKIGESLNDTPKSFQLARIQKELFNLESYRMEILTNVAYPILTISTDEAVEDISLSSNNILKVPSEVKNMPMYIEPDLISIEMIRDTIEDKKQFIYKIYTQNLLSDNITYTSAMASALASKNFTNAVNVYYNIYKQIVETIINNIMFIYELNTTYEIGFPTISINDSEMEEQIDNILN